MRDLFLDLYYEGPDHVAFAQQAAAELTELVRTLAPHVNLRIDVRPATCIEPWQFDWEGQRIHAVRHAPEAPDHQSVLITDHPISGAQGWGTKSCGVVSRLQMIEKRAARGAPVDILIHEWTHTLQDIEINGRPVPFADDATKYGFSGERGPDNQERWIPWYAYALGVGPIRYKSA